MERFSIGRQSYDFLGLIRSLQLTNEILRPSRLWLRCNSRHSGKLGWCKTSSVNRTMDTALFSTLAPCRKELDSACYETGLEVWFSERRDLGGRAWRGAPKEAAECRLPLAREKAINYA